MSPILDPTALERHLRTSIPLARAMDLRVVDYDGHRLALAAPLAPNINDKGCAFGGSMASLLTLASWGLVVLKLAEAGLEADVYVQDSQLSYLAPVWDDIVAEAWAAADPWPGFLGALRAQGKARLTLEAEITASDGAGVAARQTARFVAKRRAGEQLALLGWHRNRFRSSTRQSGRGPRSAFRSRLRAAESPSATGFSARRS